MVPVRKVFRRVVSRLFRHVTKCKFFGCEVRRHIRTADCAIVRVPEWMVSTPAHTVVCAFKFKYEGNMCFRCARCVGLDGHAGIVKIVSRWCSHPCIQCRSTMRFTGDLLCGWCVENADKWPGVGIVK